MYRFDFHLELAANGFLKLLIVGFDDVTPNEDIKKLITEYYVGNVILFARNIKDSQQLLDLNNSLQQLAKEAGHDQPLFISIDQENGAVTRLLPPSSPQFPGSMALGATGSAEDAYKVALATAHYLRFHGIQYNYAPVADVNSNPRNPVVGVRSFGDNAREASKLVNASASGLSDGKIVTCTKHFPGHGDTAVDSHHGTAVVTKAREQMNECELVPFRESNDQVASVMMAHVVVPSFGENLPASISPVAVKILKEDLGYKGLVITDCLEMDAISQVYGAAEGAVMSLKAGVDNVMICHTMSWQVGALEKIRAAVNNGDLSKDQILQSAEKVQKLKQDFLSWEEVLAPKKFTQLDPVLFKKHEELVKSVYDRTTTVVRGRIEDFRFNKEDKIVYVTPTWPRGNAVSGAVGRTASFIPLTFLGELQSTASNVMPVEFGPDDDVTMHDEAISNADRILLVTRNAGRFGSTYQKAIADHLSKSGKPMVVVAVEDPYDFLHESSASSVPNYICTYEPTKEAFSSAVSVLFGRVATGVCPVRP